MCVVQHMYIQVYSAYHTVQSVCTCTCNNTLCTNAGTTNDLLKESHLLLNCAMTTLVVSLVYSLTALPLVNGAENRGTNIHSGTVDSQNCMGEVWLMCQ